MLDARIDWTLNGTTGQVTVTIDEHTYGPQAIEVVDPLDCGYEILMAAGRLIARNAGHAAPSLWSILRGDDVPTES